jgi:glycosyltransferase involved in cell wall biosynthesis
MTRWLSKRGVPCLLDVKDQWPSIFIKVFPLLLQPLAAVAVLPYYYLGRRAMRDATGIVAMADAFLKWALTFSNRLPNEADRIVSLTTPTGKISVADLQAARKWWDAKGVPADGRGRVCFVGSHSRAFDMSAVAEAAHQLAAQGTPCEFVLCGEGEFTTEWRRLMGSETKVVFAGWVNRAQVEALAERSMAALAPYHNTDNFVMNIPNKVVDALALGLPILSPLKGEVRQLMVEHNVGWSYGTDTGTSLAQCLSRLLADSALRQEASSNALRLYQEAFSFDRVYGGLVKHLESLVQEHREQVALGRSRQDPARR